MLGSLGGVYRQSSQRLGGARIRNVHDETGCSGTGVRAHERVAKFSACSFKASSLEAAQFRSDTCMLLRAHKLYRDRMAICRDAFGPGERRRSTPDSGRKNDTRLAPDQHKTSRPTAPDVIPINSDPDRPTYINHSERLRSLLTAAVLFLSLFLTTLIFIPYHGPRLHQLQPQALPPAA